jgi:hypothetical protein
MNRRSFLVKHMLGPPLAAVLVVGALAGCANAPAPTAAVGSALVTPAGAAAPAATPLQGLGQFVTADLQNALSIAQANSDTVAAQCYQYLIPQVAAAQKQLGTLAPTNISGGFSAFEAGRVAVTNVKGLVNGIPAGLNIACAPLVLDAGNTLVGLAAKVGVTIALPAGGLAALLP